MPLSNANHCMGICQEACHPVLQLHEWWGGGFRWLEAKVSLTSWLNNYSGLDLCTPPLNLCTESNLIWENEHRHRRWREQRETPLGSASPWPSVLWQSCFGGISHASSLWWAKGVLLDGMVENERSNTHTVWGFMWLWTWQNRESQWQSCGHTCEGVIRFGKSRREDMP